MIQFKSKEEADACEYTGAEAALVRIGTEIDYWNRSDSSTDGEQYKLIRAINTLIRIDLILSVYEESKWPEDEGLEG